MRWKPIVAACVLGIGASAAVTLQVLRPFDESKPPLQYATGAETVVVPVGIPNSWERREFNGKPYYLIPLAQYEAIGRPLFLHPDQ